MMLNVNRDAERIPPATPHEAAQKSTVIAGPSEAAAREVQAVSPEGRPGDPKSGPKTLRSERLIAAAIVVVIVALSAIWVGWIAAAAALVVGGLALMFNPVMAAAGQRAEDRAEVIERRIDGRSGGPVPQER